MAKDTTKDMTKGPIFSTIVLFTIPLVLGNLLQLTYNAIDSIIVGRFVGKGALAAVGTSNPLMTLVLLFTNGICLGAGVLVSYHYGAHDYGTLKRQVSTGMIAGCIFSLAVGALIAVLAIPIFHLLQVDASILKECASYLRTIMLGLIFSFIYNYLASMLRAMGDSKSPLYFLGLSAGLNIAGDLFFVVVLHMGIFGAALSTVLCEALSAALCWIYTYRRIPIMRLGRGWLVFDGTLLHKTLSYGIVSALQQSTVQIGKIGIQALVNSLGVAQTAAFNATTRFDDFACIPEQNIGHAMTSVMAQNVGAHEMKRVGKAYRYGMYLEIAYGVIIGILMYVFAAPIVSLFSTDEDVVREGVAFVRIAAFFYTLPGITNGIQGYFRGVGDLKITLWSSIINFAVRVAACAGILFGLHKGFAYVPLSYVAGWIAMIAFEVPYLVVYRRHHVSKF
ncbi:MAG: MATE family efflux transporter [Lachnospiraceae bacterium]|nr:MATE family efflux transporter [Lachnospiraceae bacterium]